MSSGDATSNNVKPAPPQQKKRRAVLGMLWTWRFKGPLLLLALLVLFSANPALAPFMYPFI